MCIYTKNKKQEREKMKEEGVDDAMEDKGVGKVGGVQWQRERWTE